MAPRELNITQVEKLLNNLNSSPHQWGLVLENLEPLPSTLSLVPSRPVDRHA